MVCLLGFPPLPAKQPGPAMCQKVPPEAPGKMGEALIWHLWFCSCTVVFLLVSNTFHYSDPRNGHRVLNWEGTSQNSDPSYKSGSEIAM